MEKSKYSAFLKLQLNNFKVRVARRDLKVGYLKGLYSIFSMQFISIMLISLLMAVALYPNFLIPVKHYGIGDIAERDIKASQDFLVQDRITTEKRQKQAEVNAPAVYDLDEGKWLDIKERLGQAFKEAREASLKKASDKNMKQRFEDILSIKLSNKQFFLLKEEEFAPYLEEGIYQILEPVFLQGIIKSKSKLPPKTDIIIRFKGSGRKETSHLENILTLTEAKREILRLSYTVYKNRRNLAETARIVCQNSLEPNLVYNPVETQKQKQRVVSAVKPVFYQVKKGEMLVREGEKIGQEQLTKLEAQQKGVSQQPLILLLGVTFLITGLIMVSEKAASLMQKGFLQTWQDHLFWLVLILFFFMLGQIGLGIGNLLSNNFLIFSSISFAYALPLAAGAMLVTSFTEPKLGVIFGALLAALAALLLKSQAIIFVYFLIGSWWAALRLGYCHSRNRLIKVGIEVGILQMLLIIVYHLLNQKYNIWQLTVNMGLGGLGGLMASVFALGLTPLIEMAFDYTSDIRLLELANLDQPMLKELMANAPGTYHHSVIVSQLVEAPAEEIGANPLLAKVAGYYHDLGKIKKPLYFVENQIGVENKHNSLAPSLSALILISHIKDGVDLAKQYRLGGKIINIIKQHHGTSLITYFYQRAKEQNSNVKEIDFRYPGPKPQTKEAGLVMLADAVEAACRSLIDPTPARIEGTVHKVITNIFLDGQLDACELTLKDLHKIEERFSKILTGIFHQRIEYPEEGVSYAISSKEEAGKKDKTSTGRIKT